MKRIGLVLVAALAVAGCSKKSGSSASACADAIGKGVDSMIAARKKVMDEQMASLPPEAKARMEERQKMMGEMTGKLKGVITNRCTEDKWSQDVIDCYATASKPEDMRTCRGKLPPEQQAKLQAEEMSLMTSQMGAHGMGGPGIGGPGMGGDPHAGMGGPHGMGGPGGPGVTPPEGSAAGSAVPAPTGSAAPSATGSAAPASGSAAGSAKK